jgi:hypothetical protein
MKCRGRGIEEEDVGVEEEVVVVGGLGGREAG